MINRRGEGMIIDRFPDVIRIESSGTCNFKCKHCCNAQKGIRRGILSNELFHRLMEQFKSNNFVPRVMVFYHGGEPLLNKNIYDFIKFATEYGVSKTKITTNASLLTKANSHKLIKSGLTRLDISFDGASAEENDEIRVNACFLKISKIC
jgi:sulfatase maturation enzyme AslB (radical SAM superfamily)